MNQIKRERRVRYGRRYNYGASDLYFRCFDKNEKLDDIKKAIENLKRDVCYHII